MSKLQSIDEYKEVIKSLKALDLQSKIRKMEALYVYDFSEF